MKEEKRLLSDEEVSYLAEKYSKIKTNKIFQKKWETFKAFVLDYLEDKRSQDNGRKEDKN